MDSKDRIRIKLSVITPLHRVEDLKNISSWIPEATEMGIEVVLVLDSLNEYDISLVRRELEQNFSELKVLIGNFGSAARSRNAGIPLASGEWIAFWDADDQPNLENFLLMIAESKNFSIAKGSFSRATERKSSLDSEKQFSIELKTIRNICASASNPGLWRWSFRRELVHNSLFPDIILGEDQLFLIEALSKVNEYLYSSSVVYEYNDANSGSVSSLEYKASNFQESAKFSLRMAKRITGVKTKLHLYIFTSYQIRSAVKAFVLRKR
jgi:glycosyltransferase involved in cell wall biosynthesis